jgi:hypothetical protein
MDIDLIWVRPERKYFCKWGWTGKLANTTDLPVGQNQAAPLFELQAEVSDERPLSLGA